MPTFDSIVLGAGAMGSAAAYYLAKAGQRALLLEQFEIDHEQGSSYGASRVIRYAYNDAHYIALAKSTYHLWAELEEEAGVNLLIKTGGIDFGPPDEPSLKETINSLQASNISHEILSSQDAEERFPQFRFPDEMIVVYQPDSGMLRASECVKAHVRLAQKHGATVRENTPVTDITVHQNSVEVRTPVETFSAGRLVITAGSWAGRLLASIGLNLPLQPIRCHAIHFQPRAASSTDYEVGRFPIFIFHKNFAGGEALYGLPGYEGTGVKVGVHGGQEVNHPSAVKYTPDDHHIDEVRRRTSRFIPALSHAPVVSAHICLYTMTPDQHFIVDTHPAYRHIAIGAGFSGHGFKFSTGIGSILCDLVLHGRTQIEISRFAISRFANKT